MRLGVKHVWGFAFAALAFTAIGLSVSAQQDSCVKRNIYVRVEDESGHLVEGLTAGNFHATIGKKPVEVRQAAPIPPLREIVIVIDMSGSMHNDFAIRTSLSLAADIVERLPAETLVALVTFNTEPTLEQRFTADRKRINDSIQRLTNASQWKGGSSLYDAVFATVKDLIDKAEPRGNSAVLVISDGGDTSSRIRLEDAETALSASGVRLFAVGIRTQDSYKHSSMFYRERHILDELAESSGGLSFWLGTNYSSTNAHETRYEIRVEKDFRNLSGIGDSITGKITEGYRLDFAVPIEIKKQENLTLTVTPDPIHRGQKLRIIYPAKLFPCQSQK